MVSDDERYEMLSELGRGGFGVVYHARFLGEGGFTKEVALKMLNSEMEGMGEVESRFRDEARMLGLVRHHAIVGVDALTRINGRWTIVMEYVDGYDLDHFLRQGPVPVTPALTIVGEVASALHAAFHTRIGQQGQPLRLLHRDLKPSNIRVTLNGAVKVLDFGIARAEFEQREAHTQQLGFGSFEYMAPERLTDLEASDSNVSSGEGSVSTDSAAGDVYALGAVLFECLTGVRLGRGHPARDRHTRKIASAEVLLRGASVPHPVREMVIQMLDFTPDRRPTAKEVEHRVITLLKGTDSLSLREWVGMHATTEDVSPKPQELAFAEQPVSMVSSPSQPPSEPTLWQPAPAQGVSGRSRPTPTPLRPGRTEMLGEGERPTPRVADLPPLAPLLPAAEPFTTSSRPLPSRGARMWRWGGAILVLSIVGGAGLLRAMRTEPVPLPSAVVESAAVPQATEQPVPSEPVTSPDAAAVSSTSQEDGLVPTAASSSGSTVPRRIQVSLTGDASRAELVSRRSRVPLPGSVPSGSYAIYASFEGEVGVEMGVVTVVAGQPLTIHCDSQFGRCAVKETVP